MLTLAREPEPDMSSYTDPEIVQRIQKHHHAGLIVRSSDSTRLDELLVGYADPVPARIDGVASGARHAERLTLPATPCRP